MYNLLVSSQKEAWTGKPYDYDVTRVVREYTPDRFIAEYGKLDKDAFGALNQQPALFAHETYTNAPARVGWITKVTVKRPLVRVEYELDPALPEIAPEMLLQLRWELDIDEWEMNRTHWAIKDVDLFRALMDAGIISRELLDAQPPESRIAKLGLKKAGVIPVEVRPRIFRIPDTPQEGDLVSVMIPFNPAFGSVFTTLSAAARDAGFRCLKANDVWQHEEIIQDIFSLIFRSAVVICDFTGQNPNVFYEAGIAHTLGRVVVPITQEDRDVPFDLRHHRYIKYLDNEQGRLALGEQVTARLRHLAQR